MLEEYIEKLKPIILELFSEESSGHDIAHLERTMKIALYCASFIPFRIASLNGFVSSPNFIATKTLWPAALYF